MVEHVRKDTKTEDFRLIWKKKLKSEFMKFANKHFKYGTLTLAYLKSVEIRTGH
jgi:hypothetical protein